MDNEKLLVICNFSEDNARFELPNNIAYNSKKLLISNYASNSDILENIELKPYETKVYLMEKS